VKVVVVGGMRSATKVTARIETMKSTAKTIILGVISSLIAAAIWHELLKLL
jgi:hypothetical protein